MINTLTHGNVAIVAERAVIVVYPQMVKAGTHEAGETTGVTDRAIPGRRQVVG